MAVSPGGHVTSLAAVDAARVPGGKLGLTLLADFADWLFSASVGHGVFFDLQMIVYRLKNVYFGSPIVLASS